MVFRDNHDRIAKIEKDFQAAAGQLFFLLNRLVTIRVAAERDDLRFPFMIRQFFAQYLRCIFFDHDLGFKIQSGREAEVLMCRPGVAVNAAMLAASIRIDASIKADIGAVVVGDQ